MLVFGFFVRQASVDLDGGAGTGCNTIGCDLDFVNFDESGVVVLAFGFFIKVC